MQYAILYSFEMTLMVFFGFRTKDYSLNYPFVKASFNNNDNKNNKNNNNNNNDGHC